MYCRYICFNYEERESFQYLFEQITMERRSQFASIDQEEDVAKAAPLARLTVLIDSHWQDTQVRDDEY